MKIRDFPVMASGTLLLPDKNLLEATIKIHASTTNALVEVIDADTHLHSFALSDKVTFEGSLIEDHDIPILIEELHVTKHYLMEPLRGIRIGSSAQYCISTSRTVNATLPAIDGLELGRYTLTIKSAEVDEIESLLKKTSRHTDCFSSTVTLSGPMLKVSEYDEDMCELLRLISVMLSHSIFTTMTCYTHPHSGKFYILSHSGGAGIGRSKTIQPHSCEEFLLCAYPIWREMDLDLKRALRISSTYLSTSCEGYLDTQLFSVFQAWEGLAKAYKRRFYTEENRSEDEKLEEKLDKLADQLKTTYESWLKEELGPSAQSPIKSFSGIVRNIRRITNQQEVDFLLALTRLDTEKISLDIAALRNMTNPVRHTGMLALKDNYGDNYTAYETSKFALELIIFKILGYKGLIRYSCDGFMRSDVIDNFFRNA